MKKYVSLLVMLAMLFSFSAICVSADDTVDTTVPKVIYEQNFDSVTDVSSLGWTAVGDPENIKATATIQNGKLVIDNTAGTESYLVMIYNSMPANLKAFSLEADISNISIAEGATAGTSTGSAIVTHFVDEKNYSYINLFTNGTFSLLRKANGSSSSLGISQLSNQSMNVTGLTPAMTGELGETYAVKLDFHGIDFLGGYAPSVDAYINGQMSVKGTQPLGEMATGILLMVRAKTRASFDNIKITQKAFLTGNEQVTSIVFPNDEKVVEERGKTDNYEPVVYDEVKNPESKPYGKWKAGENTVTYLSDLTFMAGRCTGTAEPTKDGPYKKPGTGISLMQTQKFDKGIGMHPTSDTKYGYILYNIGDYTNANGEYKYDTLYSAVGLTNAQSKGVYFSIYGDKGDGNGFRLLASSDICILYNMGEFNVDIVGIQYLLLVVSADKSYASSASAWADLCIFKADPNAVKPDWSAENDNPNPPSGDEEDTNNTDTEPCTNADTSKNTNAPITSETATGPSSQEEKGCASNASLAVVLMLAVFGGGAAVVNRKYR